MVNCLSLNESNIPTIDFACYHHCLNFKPKILSVDVGYSSLFEYTSVWRVDVLY